MGREREREKAAGEEEAMVWEGGEKAKPSSYTTQGDLISPGY